MTFGAKPDNLFDNKPSSREFLRVWLASGAQSFGGGPVTLAILRRRMVTEHGWISEQEFTRLWTLVQLAPGVNLVAFAIVVGWRMGGWRYILLALSGMLLPSALLTVLLTLLYERLLLHGSAQVSSMMARAIHGMTPAIGSLCVLLGYQIARPILNSSRNEGRFSFALSLCILGGSATLAIAGVAPVSILVIGSCIMAISGWLMHGHRRKSA